MEEEIGFQIFDRSKNPLETKLAGELNIFKAKIIIGEVHQLKETVNTEREHIENDFKIGVIPPISPYIIPQFSGNFSKNYPDTCLKIQDIQSSSIIEA